MAEESDLPGDAPASRLLQVVDEIEHMLRAKVKERAEVHRTRMNGLQVRFDNCTVHIAAHMRERK